MGRQISLNPFESLARYTERSFTRMDLTMAATVDRLPGASLVAALACGAMVGAGLGLGQQLISGQPVWLLHALEDCLGGVLSTIPQTFVLAMAAPLALWHLRCWWAANAEAARELLGGSAISASACNAAAGVCLARAALLLSAVGIAAAIGASTLAAVAAAAASLIPLALAAWVNPAPGDSGGHRKTSQQEVSEGLGRALPLLVPILVSDAAVLAAAWATVRGITLVAAAAGAILSASLIATVTQSRYTDRLQPWRAAEGDEVQVRICGCQDLIYVFECQFMDDVAKR